MSDSLMERLEQMFEPCTEAIDAAPIRIIGAWDSKRRLTYTQPSAQSTYAEVIDWTWRGHPDDEREYAVLQLVAKGAHIEWNKVPPRVHPELRWMMAGRPGELAVSAAAVGHASIPTAVTRQGPAGCVMGSAVVAAGRPQLILRMAEVSYCAVLLPRSAIKVGRNRLWRLRAELAEKLPETLRLLLTRSRTGSFRCEP